MEYKVGLAPFVTLGYTPCYMGVRRLREPHGSSFNDGHPPTIVHMLGVSVGTAFPQDSKVYKDQPGSILGFPYSESRQWFGWISSIWVLGPLGLLFSQRGACNYRA